MKQNQPTTIFKSSQGEFVLTEQYEGISTAEISYTLKKDNGKGLCHEGVLGSTD
jgi:hypothetical protein